MEILLLGTELCPSKIHVKVGTPDVTAFGDRAFRRYLRLPEVK
jgi:hypothetical protein